MFNQKSKQQIRAGWTDVDKRFVLKNSRIMSVSDIAKAINKTEKAIKNACDRIGCGYVTRINND